MKIHKIQTLISLTVVIFLFSCSPKQVVTFVPPENWPTINISVEELHNYYDENYSDLNPIEGIWLCNWDGVAQQGNNPSQPYSVQNFYEVAIFKKDFTSPDVFTAIILSAEDHWQYGQVKIEYSTTAYEHLYSTKWYMADYSYQNFNTSIDENGLLVGTVDYYYNGWHHADKIYLIKKYPPIKGGSVPQISQGIKSTGSGFLISEDGLVVTNYHVVKGANKIDIAFPNKNVIKQASLKIKDISNDLAILEISDFDFTEISNDKIPFSLADINTVKVGQEVFTLGFPLGSIMGSKSRLSTGRINSVYGIQEDPRLFQIGNPLQPGNSGGPLFNMKGELVGIVVSGLNAKFFYDNLGIIPQNVNFAIKVSYLENLLGMLPESDEITNRKSKISNLKMEDQVEILDPIIVQIKVY